MQVIMTISKLYYAKSQYPKLLREIHKPPRFIYCQGELQDIPLVAIVGSRRPTTYGRHITTKLASELAYAGVGIVSGLALGIDAVAHKAALDAGGFTVAVLGSGLNHVYPATNRNLARQIIASGGAIASEYPESMPPLRHHFPARNRIIAGLSQAVLVTEAAASSGSLITANFALEENRSVLAVPGPITSSLSAGTNELIRAGAVPVTQMSDILAALNLTQASSHQPTVAVPSSKEEAAILNLIDTGITSSQQLIEHSGLTAAHFARTISMMEIAGKIQSLGAGAWIRR